MFTAENLGFIKQTETELHKRISVTNNLCNHLNNHKGTSTIKEIILLIFLSIILFTLILSWTKSNTVFSILQDNLITTNLSVEQDDSSLLPIDIDTETDAEEESNTKNTNYIYIFFIISLIIISIYVFLHIINKLLHILRIIKIDNHIFNIHNIENYLRKTLNNITSIALEADKIIFSQSITTLQPKLNVEEGLKKYDNIIKSYSNPENSSMKSFLMFLHWLSSILFMCVFIYISFPYFSQKISQLFNTESKNLILFIHIFSSIIVLLIIQEFIARSSHIKIKYTLGYALIIILSSIFKALHFIGSGFIDNIDVFGRIIGYILLVLLYLSPIILCSITFAMDNLPINTFRDLFRGESLAYIGVCALILIVCYLLVNYTHGLIRGIATFVAFAIGFNCGVICGGAIGIIAFILSIILLIVSFVKPFSSY